MKLEEFVHQTLNGIISGVAAAQAERMGGAINPAPVKIKTETKTGRLDMPTHSPVQLVEFDVAIAASEGAGGGLGGELVVVGMKLGGFFRGRRHTESTNRVKFVVPLVLPAPAES